jgi:hypothetical protein
MNAFIGRLGVPSAFRVCDVKAALASSGRRERDDGKVTLEGCKTLTHTFGFDVRFLRVVYIVEVCMVTVLRIRVRVGAFVTDLGGWRKGLVREIESVHRRDDEWRCY